ncbi:MAG TPA: hypothetical protein VD994_07385, partial [Prosthecobacter sp.]|nr:hypothetical protein [Prosthecobacter sp.]
MNKNPRYYADKRLLALHREDRKLRPLQRHLVPSHPPIQRGWVRRWRLTAEARNRHDAEALDIVLAQVNTEQFHWWRSFEYGKHRRPGKKLIPLSQGFSTLCDRTWRDLGWPQEW